MMFTFVDYVVMILAFVAACVLLDLMKKIYTDWKTRRIQKKLAGADIDGDKLLYESPDREIVKAEAERDKENYDWLQRVSSLSCEDLHYLMTVSNCGIFTLSERRQIMEMLLEKSIKKREEEKNCIEKMNNSWNKISMDRKVSSFRYPKPPINLNDFEYEMQTVLARFCGERIELVKDGKRYELVFDCTERMIQELED